MSTLPLNKLGKHSIVFLKTEMIFQKFKKILPLKSEIELQELLTIVCALKALRHNLCGIKYIHTFTDHQPHIFSMSKEKFYILVSFWQNSTF